MVYYEENLEGPGQTRHHRHIVLYEGEVGLSMEHRCYLATIAVTLVCPESNIKDL